MSQSELFISQYADAIDRQVASFIDANPTLSVIDIEISSGENPNGDLYFLARVFWKPSSEHVIRAERTIESVDEPFEDRIIKGDQYLALEASTAMWYSSSPMP